MQVDANPNGTATPETPKQETTPSAQPTDFRSSIPEAYREKGYTKALNSSDDLWKQFDNMQSALGKKSGVPAQDAPDEEWNKFLETFRPEAPDKYEFEKVEFPEGLAPDEEREKAVRDMFHKAGLNPRQAKALKAQYDQMTLSEIAKYKEETEAKTKAADDEFEQLGDKYFGKAQKAQAIEQTKKLLGIHLPEELKAHLEGVDNKSLMVLAAFANNIAKKYISADEIPAHGAAPVGAQTADEVRKELHTILGSKEWADPMNPQHEATRTKVHALSARLHGLES